MKKFFVLILAVLYIATSSGVVLNTHFCMGKKAVKKCLCSKEAEKKDCCKDEVKVVKLEHAHKASSIDYNISVPVLVLPETHSLVYAAPFSSSISEQPLANSPPNISDPGICILHCVFRI